MKTIQPRLFDYYNKNVVSNSYKINANVAIECVKIYFSDSHRQEHIDETIINIIPFRIKDYTLPNFCMIKISTRTNRSDIKITLEIIDGKEHWVTSFHNYRLSMVKDKKNRIADIEITGVVNGEIKIYDRVKMFIENSQCVIIKDSISFIYNNGAWTPKYVSCLALNE